MPTDGCIGIRYLSVEDLIQINRRLIFMQTPGEQHGVLKENELASAQQKPANHRYYRQTDDVITLAAVLAHGLATNHAFCNANKRTAAAAVAVFLALNGYELTGPDRDLVKVIVDLVNNEIEVEDLEDWIYYWHRPMDASDLNASDAFERLKDRWNGPLE
ncbi:MAG: type II toxin-antitoxin system death-on-curing family toxin [Pseudomonadota bacterium]